MTSTGPRDAKEVRKVWRSKERILPLRVTADDVAILRIHYSVVPDYDYKAVTQGQTAEDIRREVEIDWTATAGKRIFPQFNRQIHVSTKPLVPDIRETFYAGWDFGGVPAFVITQLNAYGQWLIFPPLTPPESSDTLGTYEFGEMVHQFLHDEFAERYGTTVERLRMVHYGDPRGAGPPPHTGDRPKETRSYFDIIRRGLDIVIGHDHRGRPIYDKRPGFGWVIRPGAVNITDRLESVRARLTKLTANGYPSLIVCKDAQFFIQGFEGGYCRKQRLDGQYDLDPYKNWFSHGHDALGYVATRLFSYVKSKEEEDDVDKTPKQIVRSHACGRGA